MFCFVFFFAITPQLQEKHHTLRIKRLKGQCCLYEVYHWSGDTSKKAKYEERWNSMKIELKNVKGARSENNGSTVRFCDAVIDGKVYLRNCILRESGQNGQVYLFMPSQSYKKANGDYGHQYYVESRSTMFVNIMDDLAAKCRQEGWKEVSADIYPSDDKAHVRVVYDSYRAIETKNGPIYKVRAYVGVEGQQALFAISNLPVFKVRDRFVVSCPAHKVSYEKDGVKHERYDNYIDFANYPLKGRTYKDAEGKEHDVVYRRYILNALTGGFRRDLEGQAKSSFVPRDFEKEQEEMTPNQGLSREAIDQMKGYEKGFDISDDFFPY